MVSVVLTDFPKDWKAAVVMDWSTGFWEKMKEKHYFGCLPGQFYESNTYLHKSIESDFDKEIKKLKSKY